MIFNGGKEGLKEELERDPEYFKRFKKTYDSVMSGSEVKKEIKDVFRQAYESIKEAQDENKNSKYLLFHMQEGLENGEQFYEVFKEFKGQLKCKKRFSLNEEGSFENLSNYLKEKNVQQLFYASDGQYKHISSSQGLKYTQALPEHLQKYATVASRQKQIVVPPKIYGSLDNQTILDLQGKGLETILLE